LLSKMSLHNIYSPWSFYAPHLEGEYWIAYSSIFFTSMKPVVQFCPLYLLHINSYNNEYISANLQQQQ
jgi:hypothetical protein